MNKVTVVFSVGVGAFLLFLLISPSTEEKGSQEIADLYSSLSKEKVTPSEIFPASDGRKIVKGVLPPELKTIKEKFEKYTADIKATKTPKEAILEDGRDPDLIIAQMDELIGEASAKHGIDVTVITAPLYAKIPLNSDIQKVENKRLAVEKDVIELERQFE